MSITSDTNSNGLHDDFTAEAGKSAKTVLHASQDRIADAVATAADARDRIAAGGLPERKYSFNALVAMGLAGFVIGRICAR